MTRLIDQHAIVPLLTACIIIAVTILIPFQIISWGYMPKDDALRHAAKVISGKSWDQILVIRNGAEMDGHPGWHAILGSVHRAMDFNAHSLVLFSVFILFILFSLVPILLLKRPEAWALTLLVISLADITKLGRVLLGRPFIVTMAAIVAMGCLWKGLTEKKDQIRAMISFVAVAAMVTWIHGGWYLLIMPVAALFMTRQWRAGVLAAVAISIGILAGAVFTGHPISFLTGTLNHLFLAFSDFKTQGALVTEFQPSGGDISLVTVIILMLMWRRLRGDWDSKAASNPVAMLALISWALGFVTTRVWLDVGIPAALLWIAQEFGQIFSRYIPFLSWKRVLTAAVLAVVLFFAATNNGYNRWSLSRPMNYVKFDTPEKASWSPGRGGIVYNTDMLIFYSMFYNNPTAPWRYVLGFEPGIMRPDDLATYRNMQRNFETESFMPWVKKMRPEDRFIMYDVTDKGPKIPGLEWYNAGNYIWIGRLTGKENM